MSRHVDQAVQCGHVILTSWRNCSRTRLISVLCNRSEGYLRPGRDHGHGDLTLATSHPGRGLPAALTTTATHPFYDITQSAFVDAAHIKSGDKLQQPDGTTATVQKAHRYTATQVTYDLTINGPHTYYVVAGTTPVLVHNINDPIACVVNGGNEIYDIPSGRPEVGGQGRRYPHRCFETTKSALTLRRAPLLRCALTAGPILRRPSTMLNRGSGTGI
ncbi:polymorphic toxin-type HINT domain-containing protein [Actinomadura bangladeshensis]|uniref:polymorphic toxin-type HINT domain-containing protein n=1 Tax=Actinomadura bangladeshensis TaxID=453573 RepID=UPI003C7E9FFD